MYDRKKALWMTLLGLLVGIFVLMLASGMAIENNSWPVAWTGFISGSVFIILLAFLNSKRVNQVPSWFLWFLKGSPLIFFVIFYLQDRSVRFNVFLFSFGAMFFVISSVITFIQALFRKGRFQQ